MTFYGFPLTIVDGRLWGHGLSTGVGVVGHMR